jgi:hypothetical protein
VPEFFDIARAFLESAGKARGLVRWLTRLQEQALPFGGVALTHWRHRTDHLSSRNDSGRPKC